LLLARIAGTCSTAKSSTTSSIWGIEVARQHAVRYVVKSFEKLSFDQQKDALVELQDRHEQSRALKRAELEQQLEELGYRAPKKQGRPKAQRKLNEAAKKANGAAHKNGKNGSVKAKYRDGKTGETWSGRGRMASWLKSKQDAGEKIEKYLV
jgi:DNA-binding protein H-NS